MRSTAGLQPSTSTVSGPPRDARAGPLLASAAAAIDVPTDVLLMLVTPRGRGCGGGRRVIAPPDRPYRTTRANAARTPPANAARTRNVVRSHRLAGHGRLRDVSGTQRARRVRRGRRDTVASPSGHTARDASGRARS